MTPTVEAAMRDATMEEPAEDSSPDNSPRRLRRGPPPYIDMEAILDGLRERALADGKTVKPRLNRDTGEWVGLKEGQAEPPLPPGITREQVMALRQANRERLAKLAASNAIASTSHKLPSPPLFDFQNDEFGGQGRQTPYVSAAEESESEEPVVKSVKKIKPRHSIADHAERAARVLSPIVRKQMKKRGADYDETWTLEADQMESDPEVYLDKVAMSAEKRVAQLKRGNVERGDRAAKRAKKAEKSNGGKGSVNADYSSSDSESKARAERRKRLPSKTPLQLAPPAPQKKSNNIPVNPKIGRIVALEFARLSQLDAGDRAHYERPPKQKITTVDPKKTSTGRFLGRIEDTAFAVTAPKPQKVAEMKGRKPITKLVREDVINNLPEKDRAISTKKGKAKVVAKRGGGGGRKSMIPELDLAPAEEVLGISINRSHLVNPRPQAIISRKKASTIKKRVPPPSTKGKSKMYGFDEQLPRHPLPAVDLIAPTARSPPFDEHLVETPSRIPLAKVNRHPTNISNITLTPPHSPGAQSFRSVSRVSPASSREISREVSVEIEDDPIAMELERIRRLPTPVSRFRFGGGKRSKPKLSLVKRKESVVELDEYFSPPPPNQQRRQSTPEFDQGVGPSTKQYILALDSDDEESEDNQIYEQKDAISAPPTSILRSAQRRHSHSSTLKRHVSFFSPTYFQQQKSRIPLRSKTLTTPIRQPAPIGAELMRSRTIAGQGSTLEFLAEREEKRKNFGGSSGGKMLRRMSIPAFSLPQAEEEMIIEQEVSQEAEEGGGDDLHFSPHEFDIQLSGTTSPVPVVRRKGKNRHITISPSPLSLPVAGQSAAKELTEVDFEMDLSLSPYYPTPSPHHSPRIHQSIAQPVEQETLSKILDDPNQIFSLPASFQAGSGEVSIVKRSMTMGGGGVMEWV